VDAGPFAALNASLSWFVVAAESSQLSCLRACFCGLSFGACSRSCRRGRKGRLAFSGHGDMRK
jgi:hypothetical protein